MDQNLPSQVRAGAEKADQLVKSLTESQTAPAAAGMESSATQQQAHPQTPEGTPTETTEQQFRTLQGKYDAEVPRLSREISKLRSQVSALIEENGVLRAENQTLKSAQASHPDTKQPGADKLDPESFGTYGKEFVELANRVNLLQEENDRLKSAAGQGQKQSTQAQAQTQADKIAADNYAEFYSAILKSVPDLDALNNDPKLLAWLDATTDPETGFRMRQVLNNAEGQFNADIAIKVFLKFKQQIPGTQSQQQDQQRQPITPNPAPTPPITPSTTQAGGFVPPAGAAGKVWTRADIKQFYRDVMERKYLGREAEKDATEADIFKATAEGRVRG